MTVRTVIVAMCAALVGVCLGVGVGFARWRHPSVDPIAWRREVLLLKAEDAPKGGVLVIGDSIADRQELSTLCGLPVFNAGIAGARSLDVAPLVPPLVANLRPRRVILQVGINDVLQRTPEYAYRAAMRTMTAARRPIVIGISGSSPFAQAANTYLRALAAHAGGVFVAPIPTDMTVDGVHLDARGRAEWKARVNAACGPLSPDPNIRSAANS